LPMKKRGKRNWKIRLAALALLAICLYSAFRLAEYAIGSVSLKRTNEELRSIYASAQEMPGEGTAAAVTPDVTAEPEMADSYQYIGDKILPAAEKMISRNPDTVAWLRVPGGIVDLPVVYRDNSYYLDHDFYGQKSDGGTLFLDEKHPFLHDTQYMVIHGHNMHDGSMFGMLSHYRKAGFMEEHPVVYLSTLYRQEEYEVIGVLCVTEDVYSESYVPYVGMRKFKSAEQFNGFARMIRENALRWKEGADMHPTDALLALSTCYEDERIVVMCRRTNP